MNGPECGRDLMDRDTIDLLKDLVAIDSQNPSLVPGAASTRS